MNGEGRAGGAGERQAVGERARQGWFLPISSDCYCKHLGEPQKTFKLGN